MEKLRNRVVQVSRFGGPEGLEVVDAPLPTAGRGEVRVRVLASRSGFRVGDRVADMTVLGSNAAYCLLRADHLTRVPEGVDAAEAAALILSWTTAYQLLHRTARGIYGNGFPAVSACAFTRST